MLRVVHERRAVARSHSLRARRIVLDRRDRGGNDVVSRAHAALGDRRQVRLVDARQNFGQVHLVPVLAFELFGIDVERGTILVFRQRYEAGVGEIGGPRVERRRSGERGLKKLARRYERGAQFANQPKGRGEKTRPHPHAADFGVDARLFELVPGKLIERVGGFEQQSFAFDRIDGRRRGDAQHLVDFPRQLDEVGKNESRRRLRATRSLEQRGCLPAARGSDDRQGRVERQIDRPAVVALRRVHRPNFSTSGFGRPAHALR